MRRRLFLLFSPFIYSPASVANEALWDCVQSKDTKEWVCVGEKKTANKASATKIPDHAEAVKDRQSEAVVNTQSTVAEPVRTEFFYIPFYLSFLLYYKAPVFHPELVGMFTKLLCLPGKTAAR